MILIGENLNVISQILGPALQERNAAPIEEMARAETEVDLIDLNIGPARKGGDELMEWVVNTVQVVTDKQSTLEVNGVFLAIGLKPNTSYLKGILLLDKLGCIITNERMETDIPGIFAAGDIRSNSIRQVVSAAGDGATAAFYAKKFIEG